MKKIRSLQRRLVAIIAASDKRPSCRRRPRDALRHGQRVVNKGDRSM